MRALGLVGCLAIGCLVAVGSCGSDDDNKSDGGTGGAGGSSGGGTGGGLSTGGTGGTSTATYSCDYNVAGGARSCWTYEGNIPSPAPVISGWQMACMLAMGMTVTSCPSAGAVGKCSFTTNAAGYSVTQTTYYYPPATAAMGMQLCMANNASGVTATWTPL